MSDDLDIGPTAANLRATYLPCEFYDCLRVLKLLEAEAVAEAGMRYQNLGDTG